jgi:ribosomal protein S18 acetylase RimI-like enzyme
VTVFVERLQRRHRREEFSCGEPALDDWLRRVAGQADRRHDSARAFVAVDDNVEAGNRPIGFYALGDHAIDVDRAPPAVSAGQPPSRPIGAALVARLAVDVSCQGRRLGEALLADAVRQVMAADEHVATPILVVDAFNERAAGFYRRYRFVPLADHPLRLAVRLKDVRATFGLDHTH